MMTFDRGAIDDNGPNSVMPEGVEHSGCAPRPAFFLA